MKYIETQRLILRDWKLEDTQSLFEYASNPKIGPMAGWKPHKDISESYEIIKMFMQNNEFAIALKQDNKAIGSIGWQKIDEKTVELGFVLSQKYWGQGIMVEAANAVTDFLFNQLSCENIIAGHFDFNYQSKRVIEKLGFKYSGSSKYIRKYDNAVLKKENYILSKSTK